MPATSECIFTGVANTTSTPIKVDGGALGSHEVVGKDYVNTENSQMMPIGAIFNHTYHIKQLNIWPSKTVSCVVNHSWQLACPGEMDRYASITPD